MQRASYQSYGFIGLNALICGLTIFFRILNADLNTDQTLVVQSYAIISLVVIHSYAWFKQGGNDLSLAYLFFLMVFIFNCGKAILFVFFADYHEPFFSFFTEREHLVLIRAYEYSYIGLFAMSCAMLVGSNHRAVEQVSTTLRQQDAAKVTGVVFLLVSVPAAIYDLVDMLRLVLSGGYFALFNSEQSYGASGIIKVLGFFLFPALYLTLIGFRDNRPVVTLLWLLATVFTVVKLAMGARLVALVPFLIMLSLWDVTVQQVGRKSIYAVAAVLVIVVFPALSLLRVGGELDQNSGIGHSMFEIIKEMSDSISPLVWVMQRVPSEMDFTQGHSFLLAASTAIPNLFWDVHPAQQGSLSKWLVYEVDPWMAKQGGGFGFSIFAEFYLNFYWYGIPLIFFTTLLISRFSSVRANPINTAFCFSCFLGLMLWPRGELVAVARFIMWNAGIPWLCYHFLCAIIPRFNQHNR
ncbi:hypothetical protein GCM10011369_21350 [Neiella marina]|uniref:Oligosaccharide repeat unit polymerase n=1 Tax=Neiella marina TaxID=508461 RepID=A0A8J2XPR2_9GAMM|nr:O-antigen polysaccharide polymerase Wzy [Neiella marina]GGA79152.1 hypothetical protein GCM10011369_21350 [Neiella marina]